MDDTRDHTSGGTPGRRTTISCDDCVMRCTAACDDCVVTFLLGSDGEHAAADDDGIVLDIDQARVVRLFGKAGLVPDLRYHTAS